MLHKRFNAGRSLQYWDVLAETAFKQERIVAVFIALRTWPLVGLFLGCLQSLVSLTFP